MTHTHTHARTLPWWLSGKESTRNEGDPGLIPGWGRSLEEGMATHSSILAWEISWTEEPGRLQSIGSQSRNNWSNLACMHVHTHTIKDIFFIHSSMSRHRLFWAVVYNAAVNMVGWGGGIFSRKSILDHHTQPQAYGDKNDPWYNSHSCCRGEVWNVQLLSWGVADGG